MSKSSDLRTRLCLVWNVQEPDTNTNIVKSSNFSLLGLEWNLQLSALNRFIGDYNYHISLLTGAEKKNLKTSFRVTTFIEDGLNCHSPKFCATKIVRTTNEVLLEIRIPCASVGFPGFNYSAWNTVCLFHDIADSVYKNQTMQLGTQNDLPDDLEKLSLDLSNLLENKAFPDVKLRCGDHTIPAHKTVLTARSQVFAAMFRNKMEESETCVVDVADMDVQVLDLFLRYVYTGRIPGLSEDMVPSLYAASDKYAVHNLKRACSDRMIENLTEKNCVSFLAVADAHGDVAFKEEVVSYICKHEGILQGEVWLKFSKKPSVLANEVYQSFVRSKCKLQPVAIASSRDETLSFLNFITSKKS